MVKTAIIIPARFESTRFPGKALAPVCGVPMIERVYRQALASRLASTVIVATDDERIAKCVREFGGTAVITSNKHVSGTDRIAEVALRNDNFDVIVNLQGDEPLIEPSTIDAVIEPFLKSPEVQMCTAVCRLDQSRAPNTAMVKVVVNRQGQAIYFSRLPIPFHQSSASEDYLLHIGIYAFTRASLLEFANLPKGQLESREGLEQLRALENSIPINVVQVAESTISVDHPADISLVEERLKQIATRS